MIQKKSIFKILAFFFIFSVILIGNVFAQVHIEFIGSDLPPVIDANKNRTIEIAGRVSGVSEPSPLYIRAIWSKGNSFQIEKSPNLQKETNGVFKHSFSFGGEKCGYVCFQGIVSYKVDVATEHRCTYVDCNHPRILIGKPEDGQFIKPYTPFIAEARIEDDMLVFLSSVQPGKLTTTKYNLKVDVDGSTISSQDFYAMQLKDLPVRKFNLPQLSIGKHALRLTLTDSSGKSDEKTIFINVDGTPPSVRIISPNSNDRINIQGGSMAALTVTVEATDSGNIASGIERVEFFMNNQGVGIVQTSSESNKYTKTFGVAEEGEKTIMVKAFDKVGNFSQDSIKVFVTFEGKPKSVVPIPTPSKTMPATPKK